MNLVGGGVGKAHWRTRADLLDVNVEIIARAAAPNKSQ
jgi:hypothetical protein